MGARRSAPVGAQNVDMQRKITHRSGRGGVGGEEGVTLHNTSWVCSCSDTLVTGTALLRGWVTGGRAVGVAQLLLPWLE
ncbi:MAG: hypothetical protein WDW38_000675 [Sanguina aurantia]